MSEEDDKLIRDLLRKRRAETLGRAAASSSRAKSPVALDDIKGDEKMRLLQRHRQGPPLDGLQREMLAAVPDKHKSSVRDPDTSFWPHEDPARFIDQMTDVTAVLKQARQSGVLGRIAAQYNFHPDFRTRLETGKSAKTPVELVRAQQRQLIPAMQAAMQDKHGDAYTQWLKTNGFEIVASTGRKIREHQAIVAAQARGGKPGIFRRRP